MNSPEKNNFGHEVNQESLEKIQREGEAQRERLQEQLEREKNKETNAEQLENQARHEALEHANERKEVVKHEKARETSPAERRGPATKSEREGVFNATMKEIRTQMSAPSRTFSKLIHNKTVEKVSDVAGSTVARPNAILSGAVFAFLLTLAVYLVAKNLGYPLSGFETIGAFILGWIIGLVYDFLRVMITGRSNS